jgi:hypothetical protein
MTVGGMVWSMRVKAAREFLARRARAAREARDLAILNECATDLNKEMEDVLGYQADV